MAVDQTGIMALPEADQAAAPSLSLEDSYDAVKSALQEARPDAASDMDVALQEITAEIKDLTDEELDVMIDILQQMNDNPDQYPQLRAQLIADRQIEEDDFPPEFDPEFLAVALSIIMETKRSRTPTSEAPRGFARGGIAEAAQMLASKGRYGDTMLAHISPREARMLRKRGGSGVINPQTGLREYGWLSKAWKKVKGAVKKILSNPIGKIIGTVALASFLGPIVGTTLAMPLASAGTTLAAGGNLKDAFKSAAFAYISGPGNPVSDYISKGIGSMTGLSGTALQAATSGVIGTGIGMLSGQKFGDAVKSGFMSAALTAGGQMIGGGKPAQQSPAPIVDAPAAVPGVGAEAATPSVGQTLAPIPTQAAPTGAAPQQAPGMGMDYASGYVPPEMLPEPTGNLSAPAVRPATAGTAGTPTAPTATAPKVPTIGESLSKIGEGLGMGEGQASFGTLKEGIGNLFSPSLSNEQLRQTPEYLDAISKGRTMGQAMQEAAKAYDPGMLRKYGPAAVAGIGALGLSGGFKTRPAEMSDVGKELRDRMARERAEYEQNPGMYTPKGFERFGAVYNDKGQIVSWKPWTPESAGAFNQYMVNTPSALGAPSTNLASMMQPLPPVRMAEGGAPSDAVGDLYRNLLKREPDAEGLAYWRNRFGNEVDPDEQAAFMQAAEGVNRGRAAVTDLYKQYGNRTPDAEGLEYWRSRFGETIDPSEVEEFKKSAFAVRRREAENRTVPPITQNPPDATSPNVPGLTPWNNSDLFRNYQEMNLGTPTVPTPSVLGGQIKGPSDPFAAARQLPTPGQMPPMGGAPALPPPIGAENPMLPRPTFGFTPPPPDAMTGQAIVNWFNPKTGERFMAPNTGYTPPSSDWQKDTGGIATLAMGGYPRRTGQVSGPGTEKSDSIPAMLSDGEFVMTARAVRGAGNGSRREGAKKMYALMHRLEKNASRG